MMVAGRQWRKGRRARGHIDLLDLRRRHFLFDVGQSVGGSSVKCRMRLAVLAQWHSVKYSSWYGEALDAHGFQIDVATLNSPSQGLSSVPPKQVQTE